MWLTSQCSGEEARSETLLVLNFSLGHTDDDLLRRG